MRMKFWFNEIDAVILEEKDPGYDRIWLVFTIFSGVCLYLRECI